MFQLHSLLRQAPDGRELYRYRLPTESYERLREVLRDRLNGSLDRPVSEVCGMFCLFASEWWRREHVGGPWTWDGIYAALHLESPPYAHLEEVIERGMSVLKRPVITTPDGRRQRLLTVACEGGLPLRRLQVEGAKLPAYFHDVLDHMRATNLSGTEDLDVLQGVAERFDGRLSMSLRQPIVHRLVGELVGHAWNLRRFLGDTAEDPIRTLDDTRPNWRNELPLLLSDDSATTLIRGLMRSVSDVALGRTKKLRLVTHLHFFTDRTELLRGISVPNKITREELEATFEQNELPSTTRLQLRLQALGGEPIRCGVFTPAGDGEWFFQPVKDGHLVGLPATEELQLLLASRGGVLSTSRLPGSGALGPLPWVFRAAVDGSDRWELIAIGSTRRREPKLRVALPESFDTTASLDGSFRSIGLSVQGREIIEITAPITLMIEAGPVRIRPGQDTEESSLFELHGKRFTSLLNRRPPWLGLPKLRYRSHLQAKPLPLEGRFQGRWRVLRADDLGEIQVRALRRGEVIFHDKIHVVPSDLKLRMTVGTQHQPGSLLLTSSALQSAHAPHDPRWSTHSHRSPQGIQLDVSSTGQPPQRLDLTLVFPNSTLKGSVPFPCQGLRFETADGTTLGEGEVVHVQRLGGIRAIGLSPTHHPSFLLSLSLSKVRRGPTPGERLFPLRDGPAGEALFDLRDLRPAAEDMLDQTECLDANVHIVLTEIGGPGRRVSIEAQRYDWTLNRDEETGDVLLHGPPEDQLEGITVEARAFSSIDVPIPLPPLHSSRFQKPRWVFAPETRARCSWLITARQGGWYRCRPVPFSGTGDPVELSGLLAAFEHPREVTRHQAIKTCLVEMVKDGNHPDWKVIDAYLNLLGELPASTFDLFRVLSHQPDALAMVALRAAQQSTPELHRILRGFEELVFLWEALPLSSWWKAFDHVINAFPDLPGIEPGAVVLQVGQHLGERHPTALIALHHWAKAKGLPLPAVPASLPIGMNTRQALDLRRGYVDEVRRRKHDTHRWPQPSRKLPPLRPELQLSAGAPDVQQATLNAPALLAQHAMKPTLPSPHQLLFYKEVRFFDPTYFDTCFLLTFLGTIAQEPGVQTP